MNTEICTQQSASQTNNTEHIETSAHTKRKESHTLLDCPVRFNGEYGTQQIDRFISYIEAYKKVKNIEDAQSLSELPHLLLDHAYTWWRGRSDHLSTWQNALQALRIQFSHIKPAHVIYRNIFGKAHNSEESIEIFINSKLELFAQLPRPPHTESVQLDMIYGLLPEDICNKISRNDIRHFNELIEKVASLKATTTTNQSKTVESTNESLNDFNENSLTSLHSAQEEADNKRSRYETIQEEINTVASSESDEREPVIKVRRTEDLMPQIKAEDRVEQEFIAEEEAYPAYEQQQRSTDDDISNPAAQITVTASSTETTFEIDSELMSQINNIIEDCDIERTAATTAAAILECNKSPLPQIDFSTRVISGIPPLMSIKISDTRSQSNSAVSASRHETTIHSITESSKINPLADVIIENPKNDRNNDNQAQAPALAADSSSLSKRKRSRRCNYCRGVGHTMYNCRKRVRKLQEMQINVVNPIADSTAATPPPYSTASPTTSITPAVEGLSATTSSKFLTATSTAESHAALSTKLILPADVPSPAKLLATRLKNPAANSPSVKCHQCGMVGYYRSICPNCSPIYFYKPPNSVNR